MKKKQKQYTTEKKKEAMRMANVFLRKHGRLSFYMISVLLYGDESQKRNLKYFYEKDKKKYIIKTGKKLN